MKSTSFDIRKKEFSKTFRGFNPAEVQAFLQSVAHEIEESNKQNNDLQRRIIELETQLKDYRSVEAAMQQTFVQAQETSGKAIENARKESQLIIQESEAKASQIVGKARNELTLLREQVTVLLAKKKSLIMRLKIILNSELDLLRAFEVEEGLQTPNKDQLTLELSKETLEIEEIIKNLDR